MDSLPETLATEITLVQALRDGDPSVDIVSESEVYLADAVSGSDVSLDDLKSGNVSLYLAFPQERIASHGAALGVIVNRAIAAVLRSRQSGEVLFMLDEFANMGKLAGLAESLTALPGALSEENLLRRAGRALCVAG